MLSVQHIVDRKPFSVYHIRDETDSACSPPVTNRAFNRAKPKAAACFEACPSPPMSGSSHLPRLEARETSGRSEAPGQYPTIRSQDGFHGSSTPQSPASAGGQSAHSLSRRTYPPEHVAPMAYSYSRPDETPRRPVAYPPEDSQRLPPTSFLPPPFQSTNPAYSTYGAPSSAEDQSFSTSPKSQRKTKGHVASACVPCKRAHLRCDAQRPCSRCLSNGKEDACVDVQHKKRGRPRLRDERDIRVEPPRYPQSADAGLRRPLSIYPSTGPTSSGYADPIYHTQSHRILKLQQREPLLPRYLDRASTADANVYAPPPPLALQTRAPEPVAYLTMNLEFAKVSPTFMDALGGYEIHGRKLDEITATTETSKVTGLRNMFADEQKRREPNYLPPILGRGDHVLQSLEFSPEELARFPIDRQEYLSFVGPDGHAHPFSLRLGLAKEGSFYFVILALAPPGGFAYPPPSPRDPPPMYQSHQPSTPHAAYAPQTNPPPSFTSPRSRLSEGGLPPVQPANQPQVRQPIQTSTQDRGTTNYSPSTNRPDISTPPYSTRAEQPPFPRHESAPSYQLPPIRSQPDTRGTKNGQGWPRSDRATRVDIGGLIEKPESSNEPRS